MHDTVIRVEGLSKRYRIGAARARYGLLRETLPSAIAAPIRRLRSHGSDTTKAFWALRDVSFEVKQGQILGIIGRNGAGKSTLLKILSRITEPTSGRVRMRGRVGSLLEVGTGFHPELTGRENIYLNGAILGMQRTEINRKFDEIVEFAETEEFLDTPVKRYSSGMYTRLAFSVAAHLEPEILIIDEVLAVGDAAFQQKCLGQINRVARDGRTVLFVSHNVGVVQRLCTRAILLRDGSLFADDSAAAAVAMYLTVLENVASQDLTIRTERAGEGRVRFTRIEITGAEGRPTPVLTTGGAARLVFEVNGVYPGMACSFTIYDQLGQPVAYFDSSLRSGEDRTDRSHGTTFVCEMDELQLLPGRYRINAAVALNGELQDHLEAAVFLDVVQGYVRGRYAPSDPGYGSVMLPHRWSVPA